MSSATIVNLPRVTAKDLSKILLSNATSNVDISTPPSTVAIVDVRDDDHIGGHIKHSIHAPSSSLDHKIPELVHKLQDKETVVFHCALSQQRGPSAALKYIRERERLLGKDAKLEDGSGVGQVLKKNAEDKGKKLDGEEADAEWEDIDKEGERKEQKVYVLDRGFVGWQEEFGHDTRLTEGYRKELWEKGYDY